MTFRNNSQLKCHSSLFDLSMSYNVKPMETKIEVYIKHHCGYNMIHHTNVEDKTRLIGQFVY